MAEDNIRLDNAMNSQHKAHRTPTTADRGP